MVITGYQIQTVIKNRPVNDTSTSLYCSNYECGGLAVGSDLAEALAAVDRPAFAGLERDLSILAAFGTNRREHLTSLVTAGAVPLGFPGLPAARAALGFVGIPFRLEELLLRRTEGERRPAISTLECLVLKTQRMTSFLQLVG
jgi:hypothetical protein